MTCVCVFLFFLFFLFFGFLCLVWLCLLRCVEVDGSPGGIRGEVYRFLL